MKRDSGLGHDEQQMGKLQLVSHMVREEMTQGFSLVFQREGEGVEKYKCERGESERKWGLACPLTGRWSVAC
jgi:hypothetical protein